VSARQPSILATDSEPHRALAPTSPAFAAKDPPFLRAQRVALVAELVRLGDLESPAVIDAMLRVPRHLFVPPEVRAFAYENRPLEIGARQTISQPTVVARMTEALELTGEEDVLEVGTGSGYQAAILSLLAARVFSVERIASLGRRARILLSALGYDRVDVRIGDGYEKWPGHGRFERVVLTAAPPELPQELIDQVAEGGILVAPVGYVWGHGQALLRGRKAGTDMHIRSLGPVSFVPMLRGQAPSE
jgi:protein-L-isoaspartate(D-aspartate) O-methyltransferase